MSFKTISLASVASRLALASALIAGVAVAAGPTMAGAKDSRADAIKTTKASGLPHDEAPATLPNGAQRGQGGLAGPIAKTKMGALPGRAAPRTLPGADPLRYGSARTAPAPLYGPNMVDR